MTERIPLYGEQTEADANYPYECFPPVRAVDAEIVRKVLRCFPVRDLLNELRRRKSGKKLGGEG